MSNGGKISQLQIRLSPDEKAAIQRAAKRASMDMSAWVLTKLLPSHGKTFQTLLKKLADEQDKRYVLAALNDFLYPLTANEFEQAVEESPRAHLSDYLSNYVAAMVEFAAAQKNTPPPQWTSDIEPLPHPAFGTTLKSLRLHLLTRSPITFRRRNIFIDASMGDRV